MLIQYGGGVLDARGSIGGQTFSRNRYGAYARARTTPVNPASARQVAVRLAISALAEAWANILSPANRAAWEVYADAVTSTNKLGQTIKLSGFNQYIRANASRMSAGLPAVNAGPVTLGIPAGDGLFAATVSSTTQLISVVFDDAADWVDEDTGGMLISMSSPRGLGVTFIGAPMRIAGTIEGDSVTPPTSPATVAVPFPVATDHKVVVRGRILRADGRASSPFDAHVTVSA